MTLSTTVTLIKGLHLQGVTPGGLTVEMDSKPAGTTPEGMTPMELILNAIAGCSAMDVITILRKRLIPLDHFEIVVTGEKREQHPRMYNSITLVYRAKGEGLTVAEMERAAKLSLDNYCSVSAMLKPAVPIDFRCELIG